MIIWIYSALPLLAQTPSAHHLMGHQAAYIERVLTKEQKKVSIRLSGRQRADLSGVFESPKPILPDLSPSIIAPTMLSLTEPQAGQTQTAASNFVLDPKPEVMDRLVTLNLAATPITAVIGILSKQAGVNIVLMSSGDQKVTINVREMPLSEALKYIAMLANLRSIKVKNTIVMADEATLKGAYPKEYDLAYGVPVKDEPPATNTIPPTSPPAPQPVEEIQRVYTLKFQGATQVANALKEYLTSKKVSIIALPNTAIPNLGSGGSGLGNGSISGGAQTSSSQGTDVREKRVLLSGPTDAVVDAMKILEQMDIPRKQVEIRVTIHDVSNDALKDAGFTWDFGQTTISEKVSGNFGFGTFSRNGLSFVNTIHALETANKAKLLASPNVSVMDGEIGSILIGEKRRFPVVNGTNANGQFIYSTEEQNVGIFLLVATDVSEDGTVTLAVNAQVSSILGFLQLNGGSYPQISTRESKSTLILKDGQTMIMGGLLRDEEIVNLQKVPLLSQIPFFGELFKSRNTQKNSSQLLISITPHVISQQ